MGIIQEDVVIVGAGIAGLATALGLERVGIRALVLERADGLRATGAALSLLPNAWLALDALGVSHKLAHYAPIIKAHNKNIRNGATQEVFFSGTKGRGAAPTPVHRKALLEALAEELPNDATRFSSKVSSIETENTQDSPLAVIHLEDGTTIKTKVLIGCDGIHSVVSRWLGLAEPVDSGRSAFRGLAFFPQGHGLSNELNVHQFLDGAKKAGFAALSDKEIYWFLTTGSIPKGVTGDPELLQRELIENYAKDFPPVYLEVVRHADLSELTWAPLKFRYPWNIVFGNLSAGCVTVAGDAMHPTTPDLGQGGCVALEDAVALARHIGKSFIQNKGLVSRNIAQALEEYVKERRWRAAKLITGSYLSGWMQHRSSWLGIFLRDVVFYRFLFTRLFNFSHYDCGTLPNDTSSNVQGNSSKKD